MNWSRGLLRLWVVASAAWVLLIGVTLGPSYLSELRAISTSTAPQTTGRDKAPFVLPSEQDPCDFRCELAQADRADEEDRLRPPTISGLLADAAKWFALPPLVMLMVGITLRWVAVGFRRKPTPLS